MRFSMIVWTKSKHVRELVRTIFSESDHMVRLKIATTVFFKKSLIFTIFALSFCP
jgi:hypothetical protein